MPTRTRTKPVQNTAWAAPRVTAPTTTTPPATDDDTNVPIENVLEPKKNPSTTTSQSSLRSVRIVLKKVPKTITTTTTFILKTTRFNDGQIKVG